MKKGLISDIVPRINKGSALFLYYNQKAKLIGTTFILYQGKVYGIAQ